MRSTTAGSSTEAVDRRRHGLLLGVLMEFVKAVQDSRQREADRRVADYIHNLTRDTSRWTYPAAPR
jgi:hypothetical protein